MERPDKVEVIRSLHQDLIALSDARLATVEQLCLDLEAHIDAFRRFFDRSPRSEEKRRVVMGGTITVDDVEYSVNPQFVEMVIQLADDLDLDQVEAAELLLKGQQEAEILDRTPMAVAIIRFLEYKSFLAECIRLIFKMSLDLDLDEEHKAIMQQLITMILGTAERPSADGSSFVRKCLNTMLDIENWLNRIAETVQRMTTLAQAPSADLNEVVGLQQQNLTQQHESVGTVLTYLVKGNHANIENFQSLLEQMRRIDKWNVLAVHYAPALIAFSSHYGSTDGNVSFDEARALHRIIVENRESNPWPLRNFHAAMVTWWLAQFNSWYLDPPAAPQIPAEDQEREAEARSAALREALRDGAFQCTLSICSQIRSSDWYDPARIGLIRSLLNDAPVLPFEPASIHEHFQELVMEHFEDFVEGFIANMPDTLRKFKNDGDDQRRRLLGATQANAQNGVAEYDRHLERLFVIMSYVYEGRTEASEVFWEDTEGNMYGFLQWFSRKVSTPLMGAFCEMFRSISMGEELAASAHAFLLDEGPVSSSRIRRSTSLSWAQMFEELDFYASKVRDSPTASQISATAINGKPKPVEVDEPETPIMLECYLRLIAHLCAESRIVRQWVLQHPTFRLIETLFLLCNNTVPSRIRSCTYVCLLGLLKERKADVSDAVWIALDQWVSNGFSAGSNIPRPTKVANASKWAEEITFEAISVDAGEADSFICLLQGLLMLADEASELKDNLPFPEHLGSSYRMAGVEPYIDLAIGRIFASRLPHVEVPLKRHALAANALHLVQTCLESFNENLIVIGNRSAFAVDDLIKASSLSTYAQMHPFARTIEWMFNEKVIAALFMAAHQDISDVNNAQSDSPLVMCVLRAVTVMNLIMDLQSTYLDIIRPLIKSKSRRQTVINPSIVSFEDSISTNLRIIVDLGYYSGSGHEDLALASLELLKKFSMSRKLNVNQPSQVGSRLMINRMVGAIQQHNDVDPIARSMSQVMDFDAHELALGPASPGFNMKFAILDFLEKTLSAHPDKPNMAHALLGFDCTGSFVKVDNNSLFANKISLFHAIQKLSLEYPTAVDGSMQFWCLSIKEKANEITRLLWSSRLTSDLVLSEMRLLRVLFWQWVAQEPVELETPWDNATLRDPTFVYTDGCKGLIQYLKTRRALYAYSAAALRHANSEDVAVLKAQIVSTLLGSTLTEDIEESNLSIFDLLDFMELEPQELVVHDLSAQFGIDFGIANEKGAEQEPIFDLELVEQLFALKKNELRQKNAFPDEAAEERVVNEFRESMAIFNGVNNRNNFYDARLATLRNWVDVVSVLIQSSGLESEDRTALALQALQVITPKLELYTTTARPEALVFAHLAQDLISQLDFTSLTLEAGRTGDVPNDRLFQLFQISLRAIANPDAGTPLRESLYNICYRYLANVCDPADPSSASNPHHRRHAAQTTKAAGDALVETIADDAYGDESTCRIAALLLLDALARLSNAEKSKYLIEALVKTNFVVVLVERIRSMPSDLRPANPVEIPLLLSYYKSTLTLLLTLAQTRPGAIQVLNAGLFSAIRASGLFATDPDIGLDVENPEAIWKYYELLLHVLRVVAAVLLSRGQQNLQTLEVTRTFLSENRLLMVGVFKRQAKITRGGRAQALGLGMGLGLGLGNGLGEEELLTEKGRERAKKEREEREEREKDEAERVEGVLDELVDVYLVLISLTGFLEFEEEQDTQRKYSGMRFA